MNSKRVLQLNQTINESLPFKGEAGGKLAGGLYSKEQSTAIHAAIQLLTELQYNDELDEADDIVKDTDIGDYRQWQHLYKNLLLSAKQMAKMLSGRGDKQ